MNITDKYDPVIGMEVHIELQTNTKMFCGCEVAFGGEPNTRCCPVCLGLPGVLPVVNEHAIELMTKMALALNCTIAPKCIFHRKNYYYPDMPKNYQISQYDNPLGSNGYLEISVNGKVKKIAIRRVHMEEDAGKLTHVEGGKSYVDYNRTGVPLMEIVTLNPPPPGLDQIESADDAREYLQRLRQIAMYLGVSDCKMEEGSMRCEPNISIKPKGQTKFGVKTEIKNLNSFRVVALGVDYEIKRHARMLDAGEKIIQETRRWDDARSCTVVMRTKEVEQEYRYFPEPDLVPMVFTKDWVENLRASLPELPLAKMQRFMSEYGLSDTDASILTDTREMADYYESVVKVAKDPKSVANWILGDFMRLLNANNLPLSETKITPKLFSGMLELIKKGTINRNIAKTVFEEMFNTGKDAALIVKEKGLEQVTDTSAIESVVDEVIAKNPSEAERFKNGEEKLIGFFVGQVMRATKGKANPGAINQILKKKLS